METTHQHQAEQHFNTNGHNPHTTLLNEPHHHHIRYTNNTGFFWYEIITAPGTLTFRGDIGTYVFTTETPQFFLRTAWKNQPDYRYWAEKVVACSVPTRIHTEQAFKKQLHEHLSGLIRTRTTLPGFAKQAQEHFSDYNLDNQHEALEALEQFTFTYQKPDGTHKHNNRIEDAWEWDTREYSFNYAWACNAILWGLNQLDYLVE